MSSFHKTRYVAALAVAAVLLLWALDFVFTGLLGIQQNGWREAYADQWRLYRIYLEKPFPFDVLALENGHRPVFPGLVRVAELRWLEGNQLLQLAVGALMALVTCVLLALAAWRDRAAGMVAQAAAVAMAAFATFWLGSSRTLLHGNESVHAYLLTACLAGASYLLAARPSAAWRLGLACVLCFVATFSFGPGLAAFAAMVLLLLVQRQYRPAAIVCAAMVATLIIYFMLPGSAGVGSVLTLRLSSNVALAAVWLSSLPVHLFEVALVPGSGRAMDDGVRNLFSPLADLYHAQFGDIRREHGHVAWLGFAAMAYVAWAAFDAWRRGDAGSLRLTGIAIASFAMGVAGIVALSRLGYFEAHPSQVFAHRYMPWSSLLWLGVAWIALGGAPSKLRNWRLGVVLPLVALVLFFGHATTAGYQIWGRLVQQSVLNQATGIAAGVVDAGSGSGETLFEEVVAGLPAVRAAGVSMFRWPEARAQGQRVSPAQAERERSGEADIDAQVIANRLEEGRAALKLRVRWPKDASDGLPQRLLVLDRDNVARGILVRDRLEAAPTHGGFAQLGDPSQVGAIVGIESGQVICHAGCEAPWPE